MVKSILYPLSLLLGLMLYTGCAGSSDSGKNGVSRKNYYTSIGISFRNEFFGILQHILVNKYQYDIARTEESPREIYFETGWKDRPVFSDEVKLHITAARTRIIVRAKSRGNVGQYKLHFYAETEVRYEIPQQWEPGPLSKMLKKKLDLIA
ncbi:MAG: hypothetical protein ACE5IR_13945, partial [bacterium]